MTPPHVLIVEDHELLSQGVSLALRASGYDVTVATEPTLEAVVALAEQVRPAVVLLDLQLGALGSGYDVIAPLTDTGAQVLMLTGVTDDVELGACVEAGAIGVVAKSSTFDALLARIDEVLEGQPNLQARERERWLDALRKHRLDRRSALEPFGRLTAREAETLALLMDGRAAESIAQETFVSLATVRSHIRSILQKLGVNSQLAAVALARRAGWAPSGD